MLAAENGKWTAIYTHHGIAAVSPIFPGTNTRLPILFGNYFQTGVCLFRILHAFSQLRHGLCNARLCKRTSPLQSPLFLSMSHSKVAMLFSDTPLSSRRGSPLQPPQAELTHHPGLSPIGGHPRILPRGDEPVVSRVLGVSRIHIQLTAGAKSHSPRLVTMRLSARTLYAS